MVVDGLTAERTQVVRRAAEGVALAALRGEEDADSIATARRLLLALATDGTFRPPVRPSGGDLPPGRGEGDRRGGRPRTS